MDIASQTTGAGLAGVSNLAYLKHMAATAQSTVVQSLFEAYAAQERLRISQIVMANNGSNDAPRSDRTRRVLLRATRRNR